MVVKIHSHFAWLGDSLVCVLELVGWWECSFFLPITHPYFALSLKYTDWHGIAHSVMMFVWGNVEIAVAICLNV